MNHRRAFTLIELLVVIAIIAILAAILFPVFAQAKVAAKKAVSLSNVKQQGLAIVMYGGDTDDMMPTGLDPDAVVNGHGYAWWTPGSESPCTNTRGSGNPPGDDNDPPVGGCKLGFMSPQAHNNWGRQCFPYVKSLDLLISAAPKNNGVAWGWSKWSGAGNSSYALNGAILEQSQTSMSAPAEVITLTGRVDTGREATVQPTMYDNQAALPGGGTGRGCNGIDDSWLGITFGKQDSYSFADGHAKSMRRGAVTFRMYGISGNVDQYQDTKNGMPADKTTMTETNNPNYWMAHGNCDLSKM